MTISEIEVGEKYTHPDIASPAKVLAILNGTARDGTTVSTSAPSGTVVVLLPHLSDRTHFVDYATFLSDAESYP